ncbi:hypothetical protein FE782_25980 [Paenibacillus antri]|uniref:Uncharacterized protein n=1 Tax=Paenibacillus antri TaxID=2582848 RepID=A0A5R9G4P8_9BACL|nr:hypothetical protein [Paenibacillus antri]TLS49306.1 hypothetical protein FE782_25980 [Paenibacillus antri]
MVLATFEKDNAQLTEFRILIYNKIKDGKLLSVLKLLMKVIRDSTKEDEDDLRDQIIEDIMGILEDASISVLKCENCGTVFRFRHCKNPRDHQAGVIHAIELTCDECGDYFTFAEDREHVSYFNFNVLKKVDVLRRRGRGLTIGVTVGGLVEPALLKVADGERPSVWIDAYQVFKAEDVQMYWERSKAIIKRMKLNTSNGDKCFRVEGGVVYALTTQTELVAQDAV